ncbi:MAG: hypothetical protein RML93_06265 [Anaerolineales bacterium]|nr:hypothetical protein [Anaerolineales bacterium]MCS7247083.1 hypothetical protein [Anaerolineales bacterium]MDW8160894.1 hypothetical protein [Anaerolineales bacterium]MDW8446878.1 hypothetical protein [Anaerolineales bacterium]
MREFLNSLLDRLSDFLAHRKGLLPLLGLFLIILNGVLQFLPFESVWIEANLLLHVGLILAIFGFLLAWSL